MHKEKANGCPPNKNVFCVTSKLSNQNQDTSTYVDLEISDFSNLQFTIDTGAMSSIIKVGQIKKTTKVKMDKTEFKGLIKNYCVKARIKTHLIINNCHFEHEFYIIKDDINLANDGIKSALTFYVHIMQK